nr:MAG TPA: hypothetical protein [Crassvirales sp.]
MEIRSIAFCRIAKLYCYTHVDAVYFTPIRFRYMK